MHRLRQHATAAVISAALSRLRPFDPLPSLRIWEARHSASCDAL